MNSYGNPPFSWIYDERSGPRPEHDKVICEGPSYVVLASLGSLVPGWLLIFPRRLVANLAQLNDPELRELEELVSILTERMRVFSGSPQIFEHGGAIGSSVSCGVNYAHLHLVPLSFDLLAAATTDSELTWSSISSISALPQAVGSEREYLFVSNFERSVVSVIHTPTSQWFRRVIAGRLGIEDEWDYRAYPKLDVIRMTVEALV